MSIEANEYQKRRSEDRHQSTAYKMRSNDLVYVLNHNWRTAGS